MKKIEKQAIPVFINAEGEPIAIIFFTKNRERVIFKVVKADEDEIIDLFEWKDIKINNKNNE